MMVVAVGAFTPIVVAPTLYPLKRLEHIDRAGLVVRARELTRRCI